MSKTCPCCGSEYVPPKLKACLETNTLVGTNGELCKAPAQVVELVHTLVRKAPATARDTELFGALYGIRADTLKDEFNSLRALVWKARQIGKQLGFKIRRVEKVGYALALS